MPEWSIGGKTIGAPVRKPHWTIPAFREREASVAPCQRRPKLPNNAGPFGKAKAPTETATEISVKGIRMEIKKIASYMAQVTQTPESMNQPASKIEKTPLERELSSPADRVDLSRGAREMAQVKTAMEQNEIRTEKVEQLKRMIDNGTYQVEPEKIAARMMEETW